MAPRKGEVAINHNYCKRCNICPQFCPTQNLEIVNGKLTSYDRCIACFNCEKYCPDMAIEVVKIHNVKTSTTG
ncbi:MAG: 4Fe-4S dicluster domain-containing protein [Planctomycetota bacterium]|jgi:2-oxoglutarate ferredoxin oxidoreductase subunit delta